MGPEPGADAEPGDQLGRHHPRKGGRHRMGQRGEGILEAGFALLGQHKPERQRAGSPEQQPADHRQQPVGQDTRAPEGYGQRFGPCGPGKAQGDRQEDAQQHKGGQDGHRQGDKMAVGAVDKAKHAPGQAEQCHVQSSLDEKIRGARANRTGGASIDGYNSQSPREQWRYRLRLLSFFRASAGVAFQPCLCDSQELNLQVLLPANVQLGYRNIP